MKTQKLVEGPFGLRLPEETVKDLERLVKTLPSDCRYKRAQSVPAATEFVPGEKADVAVISTSTLDRDWECVNPRGVQLDMFYKNPVVQFGHRWEEPPIGRCQWIKKTGNGLRAKTIYAEKPPEWNGDWFPDACFALVKQNILRGRSIGFLSTKVRPPTQEEIAQRPELKDCRNYIDEAILLEYSLVSIPSCPDAIVEAVSKGLMSPAFLERFGLKAKPKVDQVAEFLKALGDLSFDPAEIAERVLEKIQGRV